MVEPQKVGLGIIFTFLVGLGALGMYGCEKSNVPMLKGDFNSRHYAIYSHGPIGTRTEVDMTNGNHATYYDQGFEAGLTNVTWLDNIDKTVERKAQQFGYVDRIDFVTNGVTNVYKNLCSGYIEPNEAMYINATKELREAAAYLANEKDSQTRTAISNLVETLKVNN